MVRSEIEFKQASLEEWPIIQSIAITTWPVAYGQLISTNQLNYMLDLNYHEQSIKNQMQAMKHKFIIARHAAKPFGFASIEPNFRDTKQVMIHKLYLLPAFQGKGYGKKFIDYITKLAVDSGNDSLCLKVFHKNTPGIAFYKRIGFLISAEEKTLFENGYEILDYVMSKKIEGTKNYPINQ